ncbi:MAG: M48 family metalloprotease [Pseudomonadota bacterium]
MGKAMGRSTSWIAAALIGAALAGCATPQNAGPATGADRRAEISQSRQLVDELRAREMINEDPRLNRYVRTVERRIARQRPQGAPPLQTFILNDPSVNAFTTGGGYVFFNAGLLAAMENEAQFAMVYAHEVAHIDRGHVTAGRQQRQTVGLAGALASVGGAVLGVPPELTNMAVGLGSQAAVAGFTREQEEDADQIGFRYLSGAGYNAAEGARSFRVLLDLYGDRGGFFATHPQSSERLRTIQSLARAEGANQGRIAQDEYLQETRRIRREALKFYEANGRTREAAQARRNLRAGR